MELLLNSTEKFYTFGSMGYLNTFHYDIMTLKDRAGNRPIIIAKNLLKGEYDGIEFPIIYKQEKKGKMRDMIDAYGINYFLISDRMKHILENEGFTVWKTYPMELYDKAGNRIKGYNGFSITGRALRMNNYEIDYERPCIRKLPDVKYEGVYGWDGSDFFIMYPRIPAITEKVYKVLVKNKIDALDAYPLSERGSYTKPYI